MGRQRKPLALGEERCIRCGCTWTSPCPEGCAWAYVDNRSGLGICTACVEDGEGRKELRAAVNREAAT